MSNLTESTSRFTPEINLFYLIFIPTICFLIILGNSATIVAFWKLPSLRNKPSDLLILHLSITDLITGLFVIPIFSPNYITPGHWPLGELGCRFIAGPPYNISIHTSLLLLLAISIDRFLLVSTKYPHYLKIQSKKHVNMEIACCWMISVLSILTEQATWDISKTLDVSAASVNFDVACLSPPRRMKSFSLTFFLILHFMPVMLVCGFSIAFLCLLRVRLRKNRISAAPTSVASPPSVLSQHNQNETPDEGSLRTMTRSRYIKPALSLIALVSAMAVCVLPYAIYVMTTELICPRCNDIVVLYRLLFLQFCNACLDPFLYALTQRKIKRLYCSCLMGRSG